MKGFANDIDIWTNAASERNTRMDRISASFRALRSPGYFIRRAARRGTLAIRRNPAISSSKNFHHPGNLRNPQKRPAPPDLPRQRHRRIRAAVLPPLAQEKFHFHHQFFAPLSPHPPDPPILQRRPR